MAGIKQEIKYEEGVLYVFDGDSFVAVGSLDQVFSGTVTMSGLPTSDPSVAGELWANTGVVTVSAG